MHKDQSRLKEKFLPFFMDRIVGTSDEAVRDCIVVNRLFVQGPDPLFLMESCPNEFRDLCRNVGLSEADGREAIEAAHWQGPAVLLDGTGLDPHLPWLDDMTSLSAAHRREMLWLLLAECSNCTEDGYQSDVSLKSRIQRAASACLTLSRAVGTDPLTLVGDACRASQRFIKTTTFTKDPNFGVPYTDQDHGFYVGYKAGYKVVAVRAGSLIFYGTGPSTTLENEGIKVDKSISPTFGIVFDRTE